MENRYANIKSLSNSANETNKTKPGLTPRELIYYHMNNPDEPISDEDMENLILTTDSNTIAASAPEGITMDTADSTTLSY
jgi:hypothetical protein